jgi:hypothetical protein
MGEDIVYTLTLHKGTIFSLLSTFTSNHLLPPPKTINSFSASAGNRATHSVSLNKEKVETVTIDTKTTTN